MVHVGYDAVSLGRLFCCCCNESVVLCEIPYMCVCVCVYIYIYIYIYSHVGCGAVSLGR